MGDHEDAAHVEHHGVDGAGLDHPAILPGACTTVEPVSSIAVNILLSPEARAHAADVIDRLTAAGLAGATLLAALGVVRGRVDAARLGALEAVPGVAGVEAQRAVRALGGRTPAT
jgi:hypothetical protein